MRAREATRFRTFAFAADRSGLTRHARWSNVGALCSRGGDGVEARLGSALTRLAYPALLALQAPAAAGPSPPALAIGRPVTARVVAVTDGDTVKVLTAERREYRVRLSEIDAPESGQPYGRASKSALSRIVFGRTVAIVPADHDRYGRTVARIRVGALDASTEMVRQGAAWVFLAYNHDKTLMPIEARARASKVGLWALPPMERVAPWEWRRAKRDGARAVLPAFPAFRLPFAGGRHSPGEGPSCSAKRFCSQMANCAEAVYHLRTCGQRGLDGDGDGKPCERLCG